MSSSLLRKSAKGALPHYGQQVPGIGKDFLRGGKDIFQASYPSRPSSAVHLQQKETSGYGGDESPGLADIDGVKLTLTSRGCVGRQMTADSPMEEISARAGLLPASPFPAAPRTVRLSQNILWSG